ncbi:MAG TPA: hypothetical protein VN213_02680 [Solirubrobacteraceae bacterium]|nr:hypothetical protein [Solirubrobacteraceae bacterium]
MAAGVVIEHPNRETAAARGTRAAILVVLLVSAALMILVSVGGWEAIAGARALQVALVVVYAGMALLVARWSRGVLPLAAALAILVATFAAVSVPGWYARDKDGFVDAAFSSDVLGLLTALLVPLQLLLMAVALRGFRQRWHVEVERPPAGATATA